MARVGIREVATLAEVSLGTVSHYINHPSKVSPEKRERIQKAIDQLGFVRNNAAWQLRLGRSGTIAYIAPDVSNPFFATIAEGVEQRAAVHDLSVFISNSNRSRTREDSYLDMFEAQRVQGMLVSSHFPIDDRLTRIRERGIPSVLIGQRAVSDEQPSVSIDDVTGGYLAGRHLVSIGRKHIAFVGGPLGIRQVADRLEGVGNAIREAGDATLEVLNVANRTIADGREVANALAARPGIQPPGCDLRGQRPHRARTHAGTRGHAPHPHSRGDRDRRLRRHRVRRIVADPAHDRAGSARRVWLRRRRPARQRDERGSP